MNQLPLEQFHRDQGASFAPFAGTKMPISYSSVKNEWQMVRKAVGAFDVSHMGVFNIDSDLEPKEILEKLEWFSPRRLNDLKPARARYTVLMDKEGEIIDDVIVYYDSKQVWLIVNATNKENVLKMLDDDDWTLKKNIQVLLAIQGPKSQDTLKNLFKSKSYFWPSIKPFGVASIEGGFISRTGYTGEDGYEIGFENIDLADEISREMVKSGINFCGLASRDILRLEVFYLLHGTDILPGDTIYDVGLEWLHNHDNHIAATQLENKRKNQDKVWYRFALDERSIPRTKYSVLDSNKQVCSKVRSGGFSFQYNRGIGTFSVDRDLSAPFFVKVRENLVPMEIWKSAPYSRS